MKKSNVPIFPLKIVALPGSIQSLQIFEPRYVNMVKNSLKDDSGFVIAFFEEENSESSVAISKKGTYVRIIDFNNLPNGLLGITVKAEDKVSIKNICQLEDGLNIGEVEPMIDPEVDDQAILAEYPEFVNILTQIMKHPKVSEMPIDVNFNSADSIAYHLGGLIPLTPEEKQSLLDAFDASQRFIILSNCIEKMKST
ncbi:MAG: LON peptidase substrate-binding domain-containing protein [Gammaproteobacteria bacterium]